MEHHLWSPYIHVAMHSVMPPGRRLARRILFDYELIYVQKGGLTLTVEDTPFLCEEGNILLIRPGIPHVFEANSDTPLSQPHIHFDLIYDEFSPRIPVSFRDRDSMSKDELSMIRPDILPPGPLILPLNNPEQIYSQFLNTIDLYMSEGNSLACKAMLLSLLSLLFASEFPSKHNITNQAKPRIAAIREYIDHNCHQTLTLEHLEQLFHYNGCYITQAFRQEYGMPVIRYYNQCRGQAARQMLQKGMAVTAVAEVLGFSSVYAFSRFFRNMYGFPPSSCYNLRQ